MTIDFKREKTGENRQKQCNSVALHNDLPDLAVAISKLCAEKYICGNGVSIKYFRMMLKDKFNWNPRGGDIAFYELLKALDELEVVEITKQKCNRHKSRVYRMGKRMRQEIGEQIRKKYDLNVGQVNEKGFYSDETVKMPEVKEFMPN